MYSCAQYPQGMGSRTPCTCQLRRCPSPLYKIVQYLHITSVCIEATGGSAYMSLFTWIRCGARLKTNSSLLLRTFWDFFFFSNVLDPWLVESMDAKGPLYLLPLGTLNPTDFICGVMMSILRPGKLSIRVCAKPKGSFGIKEKSRIERAEKASRPFA